MTSRKNYYTFLTIVFILISGFSFGQAQEKSLFIGNKVIIFINEYRGNIQWQKSYDLNGWIDIEGENLDSLSFNADTSAYYRAVIVEANCDPVFSDTVAISAFEDMTYSFHLSETMDSLFISDELSPLNSFSIKYPDNTFLEGSQIDISLYLDTLQVVDSLFIPLGPMVNINANGNEDTLLKPVTIEMPISDWSVEDSGIPVVAYYNENSGSWEIIPAIEILDHSIIFEINHFSIFGTFLFDLPNLILTAFNSEIEATGVFEPLLKEIEEYECAVGMAKIEMLEFIKNGAMEYMLSKDLDYCDNFCGGLDDFLLNIDQHISEAFITNLITSHGFLSFIGLTGSAASAITILGSVPAFLYTPCVICIMYNSTINPFFWNSFATYYMAEWGIEYLKTQQHENCDNQIETGTFIDPRDDQVYSWVKIGEQTWMAENLAATKYANGDPIPLITSDSEWSNLNSPGYCWYDNDKDSYSDKYGALYSWHVVQTGNICPTGWHVPSDLEWTELTNYVAANGHSGVEGTALKATGSWISNNGSDIYGFAALAGGARNTFGSGVSGLMAYWGLWWSSTESNLTGGWIRVITYNDTSVKRTNSHEWSGNSIRCIKN
jgi:uncharacterized protein (TIGR02145 family)